MRSTMRMIIITVVCIATAVLSSCSFFEDNEDEVPQLMKFPNDRGPDEFSTVPTAEIEYPEVLGELEPPRSDGLNRVDLRPKDDAIETIGGQPLARPTAISANDRGLIEYASRFGNEPLIRQTLEIEDEAVRRNNNGLFLERVIGVNLYFQAYEDVSLNPYAELRRLRRANIRTPPAPPETN